jgi:anti-sigma regulatory factor (Ser/Thr protein kinase)
MTIDSAEGVSDSDRKRISAAIERVRNIASTLREKQRKILSLPAENANVLSDEKSENVALTPLIETTLNDKKHLYKENRGLRFSFSNESAEGSATKIQKIEFQRLLSNLLDNAVEALQGEGQVSVLLSTHNEFITIGISDTGIGIPKELITKLGQRGVTVGKINGLGLGLFHARTTIESWGGTLNIQSELGKGTTIQIQLPNSKPNFKYVSKIEIQNDTEIIGVDDASEMGEVWRTAFKGRPNPIRTFSSVNDFENWFSRNKNSGESRLFLFDLEIGKSKTDGIDLIKKYNLFPQSILVTGSFDNESVIARCRAVKIRVLPKTEIDKVLIMSAVTASSPEPARRVWEGK